MKKLAAILLALITTVMATVFTSGFNEPPAPEQRSVTLVPDSEIILDSLGIFITVPQYAKDVSYAIVDGNMARAEFYAGPHRCALSIKKTPDITDLTGIDMEYPNVKLKEWVDYPYVIEYANRLFNGSGKALWYDLLSNASYSLYMESGAGERTMTALAETLIPAG